MNTIDLVIFIAYCALILFVGLFVSRKKKGEERDAGDYFLAGRGLAWWAIGASIIASNISAEQFVGMSGSGYAIGLAMATYEWIAALGLIIVAKYFIPIFLEKKIFTMPQFLEERFDKRVKTVMAVFWLAVFIFINLTSILYLGALTIEKVMGVPMIWGIVGLGGFCRNLFHLWRTEGGGADRCYPGGIPYRRRIDNHLYRIEYAGRRRRCMAGSHEPLYTGGR